MPSGFIDTRAILGRFHLWLEDVEVEFANTTESRDLSFVGGSLERAFVVAAAVTALGTRLFGRCGEGTDLDKAGINRVKKDADAVSAYALSEALWYLTRSLPENHAVMVSLGEGLMPKAGETPEMGSNPLLGFGRVYARPQVARFLDRRVHRLLNDPAYEWPEFWHEIADRRHHRLGRRGRHPGEHLSLRQGQPDRPDDRAPPLRPAAQGRPALRGLHGQPDPAARGRGRGRASDRS